MYLKVKIKLSTKMEKLLKLYFFCEQYENMYKRKLFVTLKKGVHKMNKKKLLSGILAAAMLMSTVILPPQTVSAAAEPTEIVP